MSIQEPFDPLVRFAEIERLVSKIYFRFSHLFLPHPELRDFWWEMAKEEEQHACILNACTAPRLTADYFRNCLTLDRNYPAPLSDSNCRRINRNRHMQSIAISRAAPVDR
jgi:hypothetical protein